MENNAYQAMNERGLRDAYAAVRGSTMRSGKRTCLWICPAASPVWSSSICPPVC